MTRASSPPRGNQEASGHVVIEAVVAPKDGSGPCRSVRHKKPASGSNKPKRPGPIDETRRAPSLIHARRAGDAGGQRGLAV